MSSNCTDWPPSVNPSTRLHGVPVQLRECGHEVLSNESMNMFGGVHGVPEDVRVWVCADGVVVATSEAAQERWTLVAVGCSVCEAHLHDSKPCQQPAAVKGRSQSKHSTCKLIATSPFPQLHDVRLQQQPELSYPVNPMICLQHSVHDWL